VVTVVKVSVASVITVVATVSLVVKASVVNAKSVAL
jgi:hypothetical protein